MAAAERPPAPGGVGFLLGVAHREHRRDWETALAGLGLTAPQAALLRLVAHQPGSGIRQLARRLATDPMNVQRLTDALVGRELLVSRPDPADSRRRPLYPTGEGLRLAAAVTELSASTEQRLADSIGAEAYAALLDGLTHLAGGVDRVR